MRRTTIALALLLAASSIVAAETPVTMRGTILHDGYPLPGAMVRLNAADTVVAEATTDEGGNYAFENAPRGYYELEASLEGLETISQEVFIGESDVNVEPVSLRAVVMEAIVLRCATPCGGEGEPSCDEFDGNRDLESTAAGNTRAVDQLRERYRTTAFRDERSRIGGFLVGVLDDDQDGEYLAPLVESTEILLELAERVGAEVTDEQPDYVAWCASTGLDSAVELWSLHRAARALFESIDSRAVPYAHRALRTADPQLRYEAVASAALSCDPSLLRAIDDRFDEVFGDLGPYAAAQLIPCGDRALNERISSLEAPPDASSIQEAADRRAHDLARLGKGNP